MMNALANLTLALQPFRELGRVAALPVATVLTFLAVDMKDDQTVSELAKAAGASNGTISRQLSDLSSINRNGGPGLCLIEQRIYLYDRSYTKNRLTVKGQAVVRRIAAMARPT